MKVCPKCSAQMEDSARFCTCCGAPLKGGAPAPESGTKKLPSKKLAAIGIGAAVVVLLAVVLLNGGLKASTMTLQRLEGTVVVSNDKGEQVTPKDNLKLYSGCGVQTRALSYAWINLDQVKLVKVDQESEIAIQKEGKQLEITVESGSLFFNITEPLTDDETMNIRTSSMIVSIRDACGWVVSKGKQGSQVFILEGTVEAEAVRTGETLQVAAGNMAEVTVNENRETGIAVQPFTEEHIAPFVLTELENDADLSAAILEASGLDALNPPAPAERLQADYQTIIASRAIFDKGAAEGVSYMADGVTYASEGLSDAVCYDLNGDGLEELILLTRKGDIEHYGYPEPIIRLEVYGASMGRAVLYDSAAFDYPDFMNGDWDNLANWFDLVDYNGRPCITMTFGYQGVENQLLFALEDHTLTLIDKSNGWEYLIQDLSQLEDGAVTAMELPALPEDAQRKNAYISVLADIYSSYAFYADLTDINQDGVDELLVLEDDAFGDAAPCFTIYSWGGAELQRTEYETDIVYAKLIDMNQDGKEELLLITGDEYDRKAIVYSWDSAGVKKTQLEIRLSGENYEIQEGIYRDKVSGKIYVGSSWFGATAGCTFVNLTDLVTIGYERFNGWDDSYYELSPEEQEAYNEEKLEYLARKYEEYEEQLENFEQIEVFNFDPFSYEWQTALRDTVDKVQQQLMAR